ncbi:alpha-ketoglutarate-dependent dioxygenase AlkB [Dyella sp. LX-66]|uniref:alpha-ketoglutarate-dependent dioxygenase AlkB family protein n=1 Tax=unclassified Dyella TaxID=2634549 RepID=UPI001BDF8D5B|nr:MULTISPECIES: alpha-ketoglutarate-dependent dioxygenase AlkB [unclassified Dyella]MBT2116261.1 alpha-ketoglutarate-dependent dioxygenase AlkB [Dyella sp. LX-1]MBT2138271.1 alpha-ketoglutarate-dependent dioxygenase AlkB [Dyella sp. LX-66]
MTLFAQQWQPIPLPGAELRLLPHWLAQDEADGLLEELRGSIAWEVHRIRMFGREVDSPRLSCWIGDPDATYVYSRTRFEPHPWTEAMASLRWRVQQACGARFNSVLANLYRDGRDAMGWHSDDEPELGPHPVIASVSLGAERRFCLRPRAKDGDKRDVRGLELPHGSLLCMSGETQRNYQHSLPRTSAAIGARINLTFRWIDARR